MFLFFSFSLSFCCLSLFCVLCALFSFCFKFEAVLDNSSYHLAAEAFVDACHFLSRFWSRSGCEKKSLERSGICKYNPSFSLNYICELIIFDGNNDKWVKRQIGAVVGRFRNCVTPDSDEETYVAADPNDTPGKNYFHCVNISKLPLEKTLKPRNQFFKKYLIWQAIDEKENVSEVIMNSGDTYLREDIKKRLILFIANLFWPDMATCHYTKSIVDVLKAHNADLVEKENNALNVPQARPVESI